MLRIIKLLSCIVVLLALWITGLRSELAPSTHQLILWVSRGTFPRRLCPLACKF